MGAILVNRIVCFSTGQLPKLENDMYHLDEEDYFVIPTAEVPRYEPSQRRDYS